MKTIREVSQQFTIDERKLHRWEQAGYLGEVLRDGTPKNRRIYDDEQIERVSFLIDLFEEQAKAGIQKVDKDVVLSALTEKFGGEVRRIDRHEVSDSSQVVHQLLSVIDKQNGELKEVRGEIEQLREVIATLSQQDYTMQFIENRQLFEKTMNEQTKAVVAKLEEKLDHSERMRQVEQQQHRDEIKQLQDQVSLITQAIARQEQKEPKEEPKEEKKGWLARLLGL